MATHRNRKIKKPSLKRKHRTRRNLKGGTLSQCIRECHAAWPADPLAGLPTSDNPTPNGWYITVKSDRSYGDLYYLHSTMDLTKSVFEQIPKLDGESIGRLWLHTFKGIDLPPLGYDSHGYVLSIEQSDPTKLVWKKEGSRVIPYIYGGTEPGH